MSDITKPQYFCTRCQVHWSGTHRCRDRIDAQRAIEVENASLRAQLAAAESEADKIGQTMCRTVNDLTAQVQALQARADAAERRGEVLGRAMAECAILLEVLRSQDAAKPYAEISRDFMADIVKATDSARAALARGEGEKP